jgi:hypothetical protein
VSGARGISFALAANRRGVLAAQEHVMSSLVRLLGFTTLGCGCLTGRYREVATNREITYVEEKGHTCTIGAHRRNQMLAQARFGTTVSAARAS